MKVKYLATGTAISFLGLGIALANLDNYGTAKANIIAQNNLCTDESSCLVYIKNGVAIEGTDPVAYFREAKFVRGNSQFKHEWNGAIWHFSSSQNRDLFVANPEKYAPQYGGYCAYAVSQGYVAPVDPAAWTIVDGKLYLNFSLEVRDLWAKDIPGNIAKADKNWPLPELTNN